MCRHGEVDELKVLRIIIFSVFILQSLSKASNAQSYEDEIAVYNHSCNERRQFIYTHVTRPFYVEDVRKTYIEQCSFIINMLKNFNELYKVCG